MRWLRAGREPDMKLPRREALVAGHAANLPIRQEYASPPRFVDGPQRAAPTRRPPAVEIEVVRMSPVAERSVTGEALAGERGVRAGLEQPTSRRIRDGVRPDRRASSRRLGGAGTWRGGVDSARPELRQDCPLAGMCRAVSTRHRRDRHDREDSKQRRTHAGRILQPPPTPSTLRTTRMVQMQYRPPARPPMVAVARLPLRAGFPHQEPPGAAARVTRSLR